ncbi:MAG: HAD-IB family hydrolase [Rhodobacteraceae bacterium]|nr:HAD-IB family hydrolase [Paracoccaceae bacterium]
MTSATKTLAIFDLDRTITVHGTFTPWLLRIVARYPLKALLVPLILGAMIGYKLKAISRKRLKEIMLGLIAAGVPGKTLGAITDQFIADWFPERCRPGALSAIKNHLAAGDAAMIATASNTVYVNAIAAKLGIPFVVATGTETTPDGAVTGTIPGPNCYGKDKLDMLTAAIAQHGLSDRKTVFYSDHHTDLPVLLWADEGIAINPNARLRAEAATHGLKVVDWGLP